MGLSLLTITASASIATGTAVGLYPCLSSKASSSSSFISRLIGPRLDVPSVNAGGAVEDPAACICTLTVGY